MSVLLLASLSLLLLLDGTASAEQPKTDAAKVSAEQPKTDAAKTPRKKSLVDIAKAAGQIGEQFDGYLGVVKPDVPEDIKKLVEGTNERRKYNYEDVSKTRGLALEAVLKLAGGKKLQRARPGEFIKLADGVWVQAK